MTGSFVKNAPPTGPAGRTQSSLTPRPLAPTASRGVPRFGPPKHLMSDDFWSNLRDFFFERPVKVGATRAGAPFVVRGFGGGLFDNLAEFLRGTPRTMRSARASRLEVQWGTSFGGFGQRLKEFFSPPKQPPLPPGIKPMKVRDIWSKDENFGWTQAISFLLHGGLIALAFVPIIWYGTPNTAQANTKQIDFTPIELSPYVSKLPAGTKKAGGGGGGGDRSPLPPTKGRAPRFNWTQFTPPTAVIKNPNPKLAMDPSLLGPPDLKVVNPPLPNFGDPLAAVVNNSGGPGGGSGIGTGEGGGIGSGSGGGLGPGSGGGTGGGVFRAGVNGVGIPQCIYCPDPEYSDEARKAKYQGTVVLDIIVGADGRVTSAKAVRGPGMGLDEKAVEKVLTWRLKPALGINGRAVATRVQIEVTFHLY